MALNMRETVGDLTFFFAVAREKNFTRAAAKLGITPSSLSHAMKSLEERLGVRLLTRTTRSVSLTEAGERLLESVGPRFEEIEAELVAVSELGLAPRGLVRITAIDYAIDTVLWPRLAPFLEEHPDIKVEMAIEYGMVDIVADRFDIGVRWGDQVAKDMIAVRIAPDVRSVIVGTPSYLSRQPLPRSPHDLTAHRCITLRLASGGVYAWELSNGGREVQVRVDGQASFNGVYQMLNAALAGGGLAFVPEDLARPHVEAGRLKYVMEDWFPTFPGLHAYFPSRRQSLKVLRLVVDALRYRAP